MSRWMKALWSWLVLGGGLVTTGCGLDGAQSTLSPAGPVAKVQMETFMVSFWVSMVVFLSVGGLFAMCLYRFRAGAEIPADTPLPDQGHGNPLVEIGIIFVSILLVGVIAVPSVQAVFYMGNIPKEENDVMTIKVYGLQWWWRFEYPQGFSTGNEVVFPVGKAVKFEMISDNVIHSFWIPKLGGKMDVMPGQTNWMWLKADKEGLYYGQCAEFCGESHAFMRFRCRVLSQADFDAWVQHQRGPVVDTNAPKAFLRAKSNCLSCHMVRGIPGGNIGMRGPDLTHVASRASLAAGILDNEVKDASGLHVDEEKTSQKTYENIYSWIMAPGWHKPGNIMWVDGYKSGKIQLTQEEAAEIAGYLSRLK